MALVRPPPHELNPLSVNEISTENAEKSVLLDKPEKERLHRLAAPRRKIYLISAKLALFFISAISYLRFCFIRPLLQCPNWSKWSPGSPIPSL